VAKGRVAVFDRETFGCPGGGTGLGFGDQYRRCGLAIDALLSTGDALMAVAVRYPEVLREVLPGTGGKRFVVGIALGHPAHDTPANGPQRQRTALDEIVTWVS